MRRWGRKRGEMTNKAKKRGRQLPEGLVSHTHATEGLRGPVWPWPLRASLKEAWDSNHKSVTGTSNRFCLAKNIKECPTADPQQCCSMPCPLRPALGPQAPGPRPHAHAGALPCSPARGFPALSLLTQFLIIQPESASGTPALCVLPALPTLCSPLPLCRTCSPAPSVPERERALRRGQRESWPGKAGIPLGRPRGG